LSRLCSLGLLFKGGVDLLLGLMGQGRSEVACRPSQPPGKPLAASIDRTSRGIIEGDLSRRVPIRDATGL
jgi:hypothetical protein